MTPSQKDRAYHLLTGGAPEEPVPPIEPPIEIIDAATPPPPASTNWLRDCYLSHTAEIGSLRQQVAELQAQRDALLAAARAALADPCRHGGLSDHTEVLLQDAIALTELGR